MADCRHSLAGARQRRGTPMTESSHTPTLEAFLSAPDAEVAAVAPATAIFAAAGTRRRAVLERVPPEQYSEWAIKGLGENAAIFFQLGIRHLVIPTLSPGLIAEEGDYGKHITRWVVHQTTGPALQSIAQQHGFRVCFLGPATTSIPVIQEAQSELLARPHHPGAPTLWMYVQGYYNEPWNEIISASQATHVQSRADLVQTLYNVDIPAASLFIGVGRPQMSSYIIPPLLFDTTLNSYWIQRVGFRLTEPMLRRIIYDLAYARNTSTVLRKDRYQYADQLSEYWEQTSILGVGRNLKGFWIPDNYPQENL